MWASVLQQQLAFEPIEFCLVETRSGGVRARQSLRQQGDAFLHLACLPVGFSQQHNEQRSEQATRARRLDECQALVYLRQTFCALAVRRRD